MEWTTLHIGLMMLESTSAEKGRSHHFLALPGRSGWRQELSARMPPTKPKQARSRLAAADTIKLTPFVPENLGFWDVTLLHKTVINKCHESIPNRQDLHTERIANTAESVS